MFDEAGERLSPVHAQNHGKRYRYYVSAKLKSTAPKGAANEAVGANPSSKAKGQSWRLPASEVEGVVIDRLHALLDDHAQLAVWISQHRSSRQIEASLAATHQLTHRIGNNLAPATQRQTIRAVAPRIELSPAAITLYVDTEALVAMLLGEPAAEDGEPQNAELIALTLPITLTRRGHEARIVVEGTTSSRHSPDQALVDQIARAHHYLAKLTDGVGRNVSQVAELCGVHRADVGRILPLAFLSPAITAAILSGKQSAHLTARKLARMVDMPLEWSEQAVMLGC